MSLGTVKLYEGDIVSFFLSSFNILGLNRLLGDLVFHKKKLVDEERNRDKRVERIKKKNFFCNSHNVQNIEGNHPRKLDFTVH